jgi:hypothetical protein
MLLFITRSSDATADLLFEKCNLLAFRLNFDLWQDYSVVLEPDQWEISNPVGLKITSNNATHCFWWKALSLDIDIDDYLVSEIKYVFRELYGWFLRRGLTVGNSPDFHNRLGKMQILKMAANYFKTPDSMAGWNLPTETAAFNSDQIVAKSFSSALTTTKRALFSTAVTYAQIDRTFPWFLQTKIDAHDDVTIVVCGDKFHAFTRSREDLQGLDWRRTIGEEKNPEQSRWRPRPLSLSEERALGGLCRELGVHWGRFDFLEDDDGLVFLEFNANGQWAFLDFFGNNGLMRAVAFYLSRPPVARVEAVAASG